MKVAPTGGPRDTEPAVVKQTEPMNGSTNVERNPVVRFMFDDYVDRSVRNAITVLPSVRFQTQYEGDEIVISFADTLAPNTTYTVTLGTSWTDVRGNAPTQSYVIAFSTGASLDSGVIAGRVFGSSLASATILCYPQVQFDTTSFTPTSLRPLYAVPLGTSGAFSLRGLADGRYRVFAVRDENRNNLLDGSEDFCVAPRDIEVQYGNAEQLTLLLGAPLDTVGPTLQRIRAISQHTIALQLSEPAQYFERDETITISTGDRIDTAHAVWLESVPSDKAFIRVPNALDTLRYVLHLPRNVFQDSLGHGSAPSTVVKTEEQQFRGSRSPDTSTVKLARRTPSDSAQDLGIADALHVVFSHPMDTSTARIEVWHASERGAHSVRVAWIDNTTMSVSPTMPRSAQTWYTTNVVLRNMRALNSTMLPDTTLQLAHRTQQRLPDPGTIHGIVVDSLVVMRPGANLVLRLLDEKRRVVATTKIDASRRISFEAVPPGSYSFDVFDDRNTNGRYDHGSLTPFVAGEQWWPTSATVSVRARWTVDDIRITIGL
jgi:hypothetical protein